MALCRTGAFAFSWDNFGPCWPEVVPRCRSPPPSFRLPVNPNTRNGGVYESYKLISPYIQSERDLFDDYNLPRNGIGCWHPTFPARSDDVWLAAATAVKAIENYIITKSEKTLSLVYEQRENDGIFEGYILVDKKEDG